MDRTTTSTPSNIRSTDVPLTRNNTPELQADFSKYFESLYSWATTEINGMQAAEKIRTWLSNGNVDAVLNISQLKLKSLPPLPGNLKKLKADHNELGSIAENHLPTTLEAIDIHGNQLSNLPESLPIAQLKLLNVAGNKLTALPSIARNLAHDCKVYFGENKVDEGELTAAFGPEQNVNGMRQRSSAPEFVEQKTKAVNKLTSAITAWIPIINFSLDVFSRDVPGMISFTDFLNQIQKAPFIKNPSLRGAIANVIKKISCNADLCVDVFDHLLKSPDRSTHLLACLFFKIKHLSIGADIENGLYNGRLADLVAFARQEFRAAAIYRYGNNRLKPVSSELTKAQDKLWGDIATFISPFIDLEMELEPVKNDNSESQFDIIELTQIIPNHIKDWENKNFLTFFSDRDSEIAYLLQIAEPQIKEIMANDTDSEGNKLQGEKLINFHATQINEYFARIGQADLLGPVWPAIADPNFFSFDRDQLDINFSGFTPSNQPDLRHLSPQQREQLEKCLIQ